VRQLLAAVETDLKDLILYFQPLPQQVVDLVERKVEQRARAAQVAARVGATITLVQVILLALRHHKETMVVVQTMLVLLTLVQAAVVVQLPLVLLEQQLPVAMVAMEQHQVFQVLQ
jgi:hypothetical protein